MKPATEISIRLRPPVRLAATVAITLVAERSLSLRSSSPARDEEG